jgi:hypothetical protein
MTSSKKRPKIEVPDEPSPIAQPIPGREEEEAKKKARKRRGGREANILAGRLTSQRNDILKTRLG